MTINTLCFWLLWQTHPYLWKAKFPSTDREIRLMVMLVTIGFLLAVCLLRPLWRAVRAVDQQKKPGRERDRWLGMALRGVDLRGEDMRGACLVGADLSHSDLRGVDLTGADLENACLRGALYDAQTRWPDGFEPRRHGAVRVGGGRGS